MGICPLHQLRILQWITFAELSSSFAVVDVLNRTSFLQPSVERKTKPEPSAKNGRRWKRAAEAVLSISGSEPQTKLIYYLVLHSSQKKPVSEPPRPPPHPGVPLELTSPPSHPFRWCQILDHYQSCGDRWMYYDVVFYYPSVDIGSSLLLLPFNHFAHKFVFARLSP